MLPTGPHNNYDEGIMIPSPISQMRKLKLAQGIELGCEPCGLVPRIWTLEHHTIEEMFTFQYPCADIGHGD